MSVEQLKAEGIEKIKKLKAERDSQIDRIKMTFLWLLMGLLSCGIVFWMVYWSQFLVSEDEIMLATILAMIPGAEIGMSIANIISIWFIWKN
jgi:type VI protein secretion system component VasF